MELLFLLAVAPTVIILLYILKFDKYKKEPTGLLIWLFFIGCLTVIPAVFGEAAVAENYNKQSFVSILSYAFLGIAIIEEGVKYIAVMLFSYNKPSYDEVYDGLIYCVMVSLGFATVENILYVFQYGTNTALLRAITAVPGHTIFAVVMGYYMSLSKINPKKRFFYKTASLLAPAAIHALYDAILISEFDYLLFIFVPYLMLLYIRAFKLIKVTSSKEPFK